MKHEFALYYALAHTLKSADCNNNYTILDKDLLHRITSIIRVRPGDRLVLFDNTIQLTCTLHTVSHKRCEIILLEKQETQRLKPEVHWLLPLLEKNYFEDALYSLTAMGATSIQPVITKKIHKNWFGQKDNERLQRIMIAACEQAKQFVLPEFKPIVLFENLMQQQHAELVFFDPQGKPCFDILTTLIKNKPTSITCLVGPEGDLTEEEKQLVFSKTHLICALTPTVLRASDAVAVAMGIIRSCL
ncbi:MAG: RsmE family RNA methyltransferase [Candidatus Babeliaceae bacterium]|jgi:16S rRNA (uracil1498-N3)-methyltransferase